jgi:hypothetical protein
VVSGWGFTDLWIVLGLERIAATVVTGMTIMGPRLKEVSGLVEERGADDPTVQQKLAALFAIGRIDLPVLLLVVIDMVVKPGA